MTAPTRIIGNLAARSFVDADSGLVAAGAELLSAGWDRFTYEVYVLTDAPTFRTATATVEVRPSVVRRAESIRTECLDEALESLGATRQRPWRQGVKSLETLVKVEGGETRG